MSLTSAPWSDEEKTLILEAAKNRPPGKSLRSLSIDLAPVLVRSVFAIRGKFFKLLMTPARKKQYLISERRRYAARVPAYRAKTELQIIASRPTPEVLEEHAVRCSAPVRDLTAFLAGDPPVGYSALERRT